MKTIIKRYANGKEEAMKTMDTTPTIAEIAAHNKEVGMHYFDNDTLRFFGQHLSDFSVKRLKDGRIVVYAYAHRGWDLGKDGIVSLAIYDEETGHTHSLLDSEKSAIVAEIEG